MTKTMRILSFFLVLTPLLHCEAANWFIRPNGTDHGNGNGSSWTNAWSGFSAISWSSVSPGDTVWVSGGTYTQRLEPNITGTAGAPVRIARARSDSNACTSAAGWNANFDSLITHRPANVVFNTGDAYVIIDGRTTVDGGIHTISPTRGARQGWLMSRSTSTGGSIVNFAGGADNIVIQYVEIEGPGAIDYTSDNRGIDMTPSGDRASNNTFSHLWMHDLESGAYCVNGDAPLFEYIVMEDIAAKNWGTYHPNGIIIWVCNNGIIRHSVFRKGPNGNACGEGVFFEQSGNASDWQIYGNIFKDIDYTGVKAIEITAAVGAIKIFNNTFVNVSVGTIYGSDSPTASGAEQRNNLLYNTRLGSLSGMTSSDNTTVSNTSVFADFASGDFRIVPATGPGFPRNSGKDLGAPFETDMDGNLRGADGTWDVGAFEYSEGPGTVPFDPTSLSVTPES